MSKWSPTKRAIGGALRRILVEHRCIGATLATHKNMLRLRFIGQRDDHHGLKIIAPIQTVFGQLETMAFTCIMACKTNLNSNSCVDIKMSENKMSKNKLSEL